MCARVTILASSENRSNDLEGTGACFTRKIFKNDKKQERERYIKVRWVIVEIYLVSVVWIHP